MNTKLIFFFRIFCHLCDAFSETFIHCNVFIIWNAANGVFFFQHNKRKKPLRVNSNMNAKMNANILFSGLERFETVVCNQNQYYTNSYCYINCRYQFGKKSFLSIFLRNSFFLVLSSTLITLFRVICLYYFSILTFVFYCNCNAVYWFRETRHTAGIIYVEIKTKSFVKKKK